MTTRRLIIFTRYPESGKTKTRLIPALGSYGAALVQKQMAGHTIKTVSRFVKKFPFPVGVEIRYDGAGLNLMTAWLGTDKLYRLQGKGDIGERMAHALDSAFKNGIKQAVLIGSDCPAIKPALLNNAFYSLEANDATFGPARDGGYYLIGLRTMIWGIFRCIDWGTDRVLAQTLNTLKIAGIKYNLLDMLDDIDRPEDLHVWERIKNESP